MQALELENVSKSFRNGFLGKKQRVLANLSLSVASGEAFGFLGHNGAGKTTTIKLILGFLKLDSGKISIFGSTGATRDAKARIGFLSEDVGLYPFLTSEEMLRFMGKLFGLERSVLEPRKNRLLQTVGLAEHAGTRIKRFSKGMRQRLGIAVALMNDPQLLLLDEPYSGLDPLGRKHLKDIFLSLKSAGRAILLSSHVAPDVEAVCDRVGILKNGRIARFLDLRELYKAQTGEIEVTASGVSARLLAATLAGVEVVNAKPDVAIVRCRGEEVLKSLISNIYSSGGVVQEIRRAKATLEECLVETLEEKPGKADEDEKTKRQSPEPSWSS